MIRSVTEEDFSLVFQYVEKLWTYNPYSEGAVKPVFDRILSDPNSFLFLLEEDGYKGFIHGCFFDTFWMSGKTCYVSSLYVEDAQRKKGYGKMLIEHMKKYAKEQGSKAIILDSGFPRTDAHAFYEHNGFEKSCYGFEMLL